MWLIMTEKLVQIFNCPEVEVYKYNYIHCINYLAMTKQRDEYIASLEAQARQ